MATVGNLFVNVGASTAGLQRGMSAAKKQVDDFAKKAQGTLGNLGQVIPDMGGVTGYLSSAIDKFGALKDMAGVFTEGVKQAKRAQEELTKAIEASKAAEAALASAKGSRRNIGMARAELAKQGINPNKAAQALSIVDTSPLRDKVAKSAQAAAAAEKSLTDAQAAGAALTASKHAEHLAAMRDKVTKASEKLTTAENALKAAQYRATISKGGRDPWTGRFVAAQSAAKQAKAERDLARAGEGVAAAMQSRLSAQNALNAAQAAGPVLQGQQAILAATNALTEAKKKQAEAERALGAARASNQAKEKTRASLSARGIDTTNLGKSLRLDDLSKYQKAVESAKASVADKQAAVSKLSGGFRAFGLVGKGAMLAVGAAAVAAVAAVGGLLAVTKGAAKRMDALKDEAAATGMTVEGLQRLKNTYLELGVAEGVATMASQRLAISLEEAVRGGEDAREKFARLGIDYKQIAAMSPDEALAATIGKLRELGSSRARVAALRDLFGRQGMGMAAAVNATNEELAVAQERAAKLVIPSAMVHDLAETNDSIEAMGKAFENVFTMLGSTFSPVLRDLSDQLFEMMTADTDALLGGLQAIALVCAVIYDVVALIVNAIRLVWNLVQAVAGIVVSALSAAFGAVLKVVQAVVYGVEWLAGSGNAVSESIGNAAAVAFGTAEEAAKAAGSDAMEGFQAAIDAVNPNATTAVISQIGKSWEKTSEAMGNPVELDVALNERARKDIERTLQGLRDDASKLELGDEASVLAGLQGMGATEAQVDEARALQDKIKQLNIAKSISEETVRVQEDIAKATMTAAEYAYRKARADGATDEQARTLASMQEQLATLEKQKQQIEANSSTLSEMRAKVDEIGRSEGEIVAMKLRQNNATEDQIAEAMRLQSILDKAKIDESVAKHFADLNDKLREVQGSEASLLENQLRNMGLVGDALADAVAKSLDIQKQIAAAEKAAADRKEVEDTLASLTEKFKDIGLDEVGKLTRRLTEAGASKEEIAKAASMQKAIDAAGGDGKDAAAGVTDSVSTAIGSIALAGTVIDDRAWQDDLLAESMTQAELLAQIAANTAQVPTDGAQVGASLATVPAVRGIDRSETDLAALLQQSLTELKSINSNTKAFSEVLS
jgi:hypothetical protein